MDGVPTLQQAAGWGFAELWQMAKDYLAANIGEPLAFGLRAAGYLLVAGVLGLLAGEVGCWTITGWDLLLLLFGWWLCFALLLGAAVAWLIQARKRRGKQAER